jgi:serine/threonine-protein kinase RsbW
MTAIKTSYVFESDLASVEKAEQLALDAAAAAGLEEDASGSIGIAIREAVINAILHGNRRDPAKHVTFTVEKTPERLTFTVRDEGEGLNPETVADPLDPTNLLKGSGRGIFMIRAYMDKVEFPQVPSGTEISMTKYLSAAGGGGQR